jgi:hypothetical protein
MNRTACGLKLPMNLSVWAIMAHYRVSEERGSKRWYSPQASVLVYSLNN